MNYKLKGDFINMNSNLKETICIAIKLAAISGLIAAYTYGAQMYNRYIHRPYQSSNRFSYAPSRRPSHPSQSRPQSTPSKEAAPNASNEHNETFGECPICYEAYDNGDHARVHPYACEGQEPHYMCQECYLNILNQEGHGNLHNICPFCRAEPRDQ